MARKHARRSGPVVVLVLATACASGGAALPDHGDADYGDEAADGGGEAEAPVDILEAEGGDGDDGEAGPVDEAGEEDGAAGEDAGPDGDADTDADAGGPCTTAGDCDDGIDCTRDECDDVAHVCVHDPDDLACDDGNPCTIGEACDPAAGCSAGAPRDCDDGITCTRDECLPLTGGCMNTPAHERCTPPEMCRPELGGCAAPTPCTSDRECDDGNPCNGAETCGGEFGCRAGTPVDCDDDVRCTTDLCNPLTAACSHTPEDWRCEDGNACNGHETCDAAADCRPGTPVDCSDGIPCTADSCDILTGGCAHAPDDGRCDDGVFCNGAESCAPGAGCTGGAAPGCSDGIACTVDACDPAADACTHTPNDASCADGRFCNGAEICSGGVGCVAGTPPRCDDGRACTTDRCDPAAAGGAGACVADPPDRDGDTWGDADCTGTDCDDGAPGVHPGAAELCNGIDENCDGAADETFPCAAGSSRSCTLGSCTGSQTCSPTCAWGGCTVAGVEVCNGLDDNCDGTSDEGFACRLGAVQACSVGSCAGFQTCVAGCTWDACTASASESCNGADDDCDGATDEGYSCILGRTQPCTVGACSGTQTCIAGCSWDACTASTPETCNGWDDDCNGATDETFACSLGAVSGCTNACFVGGTQTCTAPWCTWGACCAGSEVCGNACDDDCNGALDEGCCIGGTSSFTFPNSTDSVNMPDYPWMWHAGDYYQGPRTTSVPCATSLDVTIYAYWNNLACDMLSGRILLNGVPVALFDLPPGYGALSGTVTFAPIYGPTYTVRLEATRQVASGCGAVWWEEDVSPWTIH